MTDTALYIIQSRGPSFAQIVAVVNRPIDTLSDEELTVLKDYHEKNKECAESWLSRIEDERWRRVEQVSLDHGVSTEVEERRRR